MWKSKIELAEERVRELRAFAASGKKKQDVKVEERMVFATNSAEVWRLDTNEKIRFRALSIDERQESLPLPGEPLTAMVAEVARAKKGKRKGGVAALLDDVAAFAVAPESAFNRCEKTSAAGEQCTRPAAHRGAHGYASKDGAS